MAKTTKSQSSDARSADDKNKTDNAQIDDAEIVDESPGRADASAAADDGDGVPKPGKGDSPDATDDALTAADKASEAPATPDDSAQPNDAAQIAGDEPEAVSASAPPPVVRETVVERKGGFVPMLLGGLVAGAIGYGAATYLPQADVENPFETETRAALSDQATRIDGLTSQLAETATSVDGLRTTLDAVDTAPIQAALDDLRGTLDATRVETTALADALAAFDSRVTAIEKQPLAGAVSPEAIAAYERELEELRAAIDMQTAEVEAAAAGAVQTYQQEIAKLQAAVDEQSARIEAMASEALQAEASAEEKAEIAQSRAALADLMSRLQAGEPLAEPLAVLEANGVAVPAVLSETAQDGVPTLAALTAEFPVHAREALRVVRSEAPSGGLSGFLEAQLGVRSVTPREGDDPDAVLSRAEAALRNGDIHATLTEIATLPESGQAVLAEWITKAGVRRDAQAAASELAQSLNAE
ncbi:hypothetical protein KUH32_07050 [Thalassococcus sp. CAU 1522]|uniref:Mitochondrial inner membrane protein n=1 Tax=Thalassococcus arenae TaxID=2851652 RepID=A0ABS6N692_9RHOB|nr:hypothetical protein [Thalassococcus arenae]MBV2359525.1 hypothetical protein [Thalassococcus arenae]